jgi:hypothetical protein
MTFTLRVPYRDPDRRHVPRIEGVDSANVYLGREAAEVTTEHWADPPDDYEVVDGEVYECDHCRSLWATEEARNAHMASH